MFFSNGCRLPAGQTPTSNQKKRCKLSLYEFADDNDNNEAVGLPVDTGDSLAWRVRVTANSDPSFLMQPPKAQKTAQQH